MSNENKNDRDKQKTILVCCGTGCIASGSLKVAETLEKEIQRTNTKTTVKSIVKRTGCNGFCEHGPIVKIMPDDISYYKVKTKHIPEIVKSIGGEPFKPLLCRNEEGKPVLHAKDNPFYRDQMKIALRNIGTIDPLSIDDYLAHDGYKALKKALSMSPDAIINEVEVSGLRGRGGAGFPTGRKWRTALGYEATPKYVICNGDEGDPGAFMDRSIIEGDPHSVIEGLAICAITIGAEKGFLYIRNEYALALANMTAAMAAAEKEGILGDSVMGSGKKLTLEIVRGGGAFVCGESTALMASISGHIGEPRAKYIRSVEKGLWDQPTVLNNVETLANIPVILQNGGKAFSRMGTEGSKGTKVFALVGKVERTGLVEVPMGTTLRNLIYKIGGGIRGGRPFKAVQTGGPSGGCLPASLLDLPVDFDTLAEYGTMMGSGGLIVLDDRSCMVEVARYYIAFLADESCGKCTPCREGLRQMETILLNICEGKGKEKDIETLEKLCHTMVETSLCALGKTAPNPVLSTLQYFREEYESHIHEKCCPAGVCPKLTSFSILEETCTGCTACAKVCPSGAITGQTKKPHKIDQSLCISCGSCRTACRFDAITTGKQKREETP